MLNRDDMARIKNLPIVLITTGKGAYKGYFDETMSKLFIIDESNRFTGRTLTFKNINPNAIQYLRGSLGSMPLQQGPPRQEAQRPPMYGQQPPYNNGQWNNGYGYNQGMPMYGNPPYPHRPPQYPPNYNQPPQYNQYPNQSNGYGYDEIYQEEQYPTPQNEYEYNNGYNGYENPQYSEQQFTDEVVEEPFGYEQPASQDVPPQVQQPPVSEFTSTGAAAAMSAVASQQNNDDLGFSDINIDPQPIPTSQEPVENGDGNKKKFTKKKIGKLGKPLKPCQTIAVCTPKSGGGSTHHAIAIASFLNRQGFKTCYYEAKKTSVLEDLALCDERMESYNTYYKYNGKLVMYPFETPMQDILDEKYQFLVIDYGSDEFIHPNDYLTRDLKIASSGCKVWETARMHQNIKEGFYSTVKIIMNFSEQKERKFIKEAYPELDISFAEFSPNPFNGTENDALYYDLLKPLFKQK